MIGKAKRRYLEKSITVLGEDYKRTSLSRVIDIKSVFEASEDDYDIKREIALRKEKILFVIIGIAESSDILDIEKGVKVKILVQSKARIFINI
jgi:hypothetical protein